MKCKFCGAPNQYPDFSDYCNYCWWVRNCGYEVPYYIPEEQKERYLDSLMKRDRT
jgi:hypothetical protein